MNTNNTAVIILNYKNYQDTINCITSLYEFSSKDSVTVMVVDNNSGNDSLKYIKDAFAATYNVADCEVSAKQQTPGTNIYLIQNFNNTGYAAGNNIGLKVGYAMGFKYLMVLNNDTLFIDNALEKLQKTLDSNKNVLCVGPLLLKRDAKEIDYNCAKRRPTVTDIFRLSYFGQWMKNDAWRAEYYYMKRNPAPDKPIKVDIISGSCMFFNAEKFNNIGFFDDNTFLYYEEAIIAEKGLAKGYHMMLDPTTKVIHLGAQSTKTQSTSLFTLNCEYNSLKLYLTKYRKLSWLKTNMILLNNALFIKAFKLKSK